MPQERKTQNFGIETVRTFIDGLGRDYAVISANNNSAASRLVWFVAIAGFALLNVGKLAKGIVGSSLTSGENVLLVLPWAFVGLCGVIAHWLTGELGAIDNNYYMMKQHSIRSWLATAPRNPKIQEVTDILNVDEKDPEVSIRRKAVEKLAPAVSFWEKATFIALLISFAWSVIFPLIISSCNL